MFWAASVDVVGNLLSGSICAAASTGFVNLKSDGRDACESCAAARAGWNGTISCLTLSERCVQLLEACSKASAEATLGGTPIACKARNEVSGMCCACGVCVAYCNTWLYAQLMQVQRREAGKAHMLTAAWQGR